MTSKPRVLSGMRPTGKLHLGNYLGALEHWVRMQDDYECFFFVASWHALTTDAQNSGQAPESTIEMAADWLGAGLDPERWSAKEAERFCMLELPRWLRRNGYALGESRLAKLARTIARFDPSHMTPEEHFARLSN